MSIVVAIENITQKPDLGQGLSSAPTDQGHNHEDTLFPKADTSV